MAGVGLSAAGHAQAELVARRFSAERIDVVESSPQQRALQTAQPIAAQLDLPLRINRDIDEIDAGEWTGLPFDRLARDPRWQAWNEKRATSRPPGGESMRQLQARVVRHLECLRSSGTVAILVSHAEPIRAAIMHYRGVRLDDFAGIEIDPASVSVLDMKRDGVDVLTVNMAVTT